MKDVTGTFGTGLGVGVEGRGNVDNRPRKLTHNVHIVFHNRNDLNLGSSALAYA